MSDLGLPWFTNLPQVLGAFVGLSAAFHVLLIWLIPLGKSGWKKVDYAWLAFALIGVLGSVGAARQLVARNLLSLAESGLEGNARFVASQIAFGSSPAICRKFERTEFSPPPETFDRIQHEFDDLCEWFKVARGKIAVVTSGSQMDRQALSMLQLAGPPPRDPDITTLRNLQLAMDDYNRTLDRYKRMHAAATRSGPEEILAVIGPLLAIIALALRVTKVTGELLLDRRAPEGASRRSVR